MGAAFAGQGDAGRGSDDDKFGPGITTVKKSVQSPADEVVVESAHRQERLAEQFVRETELAQGHEQIVLGQSQLEVLAPRALGPFQGASIRLGREMLAFELLPNP